MVSDRDVRVICGGGGGGGGSGGGGGGRGSVAM